MNAWVDEASDEDCFDLMRILRGCSCADDDGSDGTITNEIIRGGRRLASIAFAGLVTCHDHHAPAAVLRRCEFISAIVGLTAWGSRSVYRHGSSGDAPEEISPLGSHNANSGGGGSNGSASKGAQHLHAITGKALRAWQDHSQDAQLRKTLESILQLTAVLAGTCDENVDCLSFTTRKTDCTVRTIICTVPHPNNDPMSQR